MKLIVKPHKKERGRARTLLAYHLAVKTGEFKDNGKVKALYRKTGTVML